MDGTAPSAKFGDDLYAVGDGRLTDNSSAGPERLVARCQTRR